MSKFERTNSTDSEDYNFMPSRKKIKKTSCDCQTKELKTYINSLQNDINNLKDIILRQNLTFNNTINENIKKVAESVSNLKDLITQQNNVLTGVLAEINTALKDELNPHLRKPKFLNSFPLQNEDAIKDFEAGIDNDSHKDVIITFKTLLNPGGIRKNLNRIFSVPVILDHNMEGNHNKKRLLKYTKIIDTLYDAVALSSYSKDEFLVDLRSAVKAMKNKHFKSLPPQKKDAPQ